MHPLCSARPCLLMQSRGAAYTMHTLRSRVPFWSRARASTYDCKLRQDLPRWPRPARVGSPRATLGKLQPHRGCACIVDDVVGGGTTFSDTDNVEKQLVSGFIAHLMKPVQQWPQIQPLAAFSLTRASDVQLWLVARIECLMVLVNGGAELVGSSCPKIILTASHGQTLASKRFAKFVPDKQSICGAARSAATCSPCSVMQRKEHRREGMVVP